MRRLGLIPACLALLQAFFIAPYQHVHVGPVHQKHSDGNEATIVHAHPYAISVPANRSDEPTIQHSHKAHSSIALDTFTTVAQGAISLLFQPESRVQISAPIESVVWVEITEPCGHDPPCTKNTVPRAPPL